MHLLATVVSLFTMHLYSGRFMHLLATVVSLFTMHLYSWQVVHVLATVVSLFTMHLYSWQVHARTSYSGLPIHHASVLMAGYARTSYSGLPIHHASVLMAGTSIDEKLVTSCVEMGNIATTTS